MSVFVGVSKETVPANLVVIFVPTEVDGPGFAHNVVFGYKSPVTAVDTVVPIVAHHPVVVLLNSVMRGRLSIYQYLALSDIEEFPS